ncbi:hypothetical protein ABHB17_03920 [[Eubacterium] siraeum]
MYHPLRYKGLFRGGRQCAASNSPFCMFEISVTTMYGECLMAHPFDVSSEQKQEKVLVINVR